MFFTKKDDRFLLRVRLTPNSSCCRTNGIFCDENNEMYLKITVRAAPENGKANKELIDFLAKTLNISKSCITLIGGAQNRLKKIRITDIEENTLLKLTKE